MKPTSVKCFLDSNIILYLNEAVGSFKKEKVKHLISLNPFISSQVVFECLNVCIKKYKYSKDDSIHFVTNLLNLCTIVTEEKQTCILALELFSKYQFQGYDSKIVSSALIGDCATLYSEDMQNGLLVNNKLTIINPFLAYN